MYELLQIIGNFLLLLRLQIMDLAYSWEFFV